MAEARRTPHRGIRRFTLGRGPLKRGSDRLECAARVLLVLVAVLSVPIALAVGTGLRADLQETAARQAAERTLTTAVATADASVRRGAALGGSPVVPAWWTTPDGAVTEGDARAPAGTGAGEVFEIWVTADGRQAGPPLTSREATQSAVVLTLVGWTGALAATGLLHVVLCWLLGRHRARDWAREWAAVEPTWTRRVP
ncbi:hypothetical protein [Geodermatophilus sp. CPCC 206100]|uniref:Rv1733c family protein n=1 Tax=Geodermatophilus sp. CPCC 206100 TaxID=3020054 RepID=UPI003AFFA526